MAEEKKSGQETQTESSCCTTSTCCSGRKFLVAIVLGFLLFGAGYLCGQNCAGKVCPMKQMPMQMPMQK